MYESIPHELRTMEAGSKRMEPYKRGLLHRAAKAIEELSMKLHGDEAAIAGMKREIERMVRADKPRWIPVTERLPEKKRASYLCLTDGGYCKQVRWTNSIYGLVESDNWGWSIFDVPQFSHVTHWMPLPPAPEPPKEET